MCQTGGPRCASHLRKQIDALEGKPEKSAEDKKEIKDLIIAYCGTKSGQYEMESRIQIAQQEGDMSKASKLARIKDKSAQLREEFIINKKVSEALPTGILSPARLDDKGNVTKPAITFEQYYSSTNKKHFLTKEESQNPEKMKEFLRTSGSQYDPQQADSLAELLKRTIRMRKNGLKGDDKDKLIAQGAHPSSFSPGYRYLMTPTRGYLGGISSHGLADDTPLSFYEKVPGSNIVAITIEQKEKPVTNYGVIVMAPRSTASPANPGNNEDILVTTHPGNPSIPNAARAKLSRDEKEEYDRTEHEALKKLQSEGRLTVGEVRKMKGNRDFNLNVTLA